MFATNWSSNGGLAAEASVTCRRSQWSNFSHFSLLFSPTMRFFCYMTTTPKLGTKDLLKAQRWVGERESNLLPLLYKLNSLTPIPSLPLQYHQSIHFLQDFSRQCNACKILTRILQNIYHLEAFYKESISCKNLTRSCNKNALPCKILQGSSKICKNLARNLFSSTREVSHPVDKWTFGNRIFTFPSKYGLIHICLLSILTFQTNLF